MSAAPAIGQVGPFTPRDYGTEVAPILEERCASCHGSQGVAGLRLDSEEGIRATALGVPATGWPGWLRVAAARPGESYLLYKIVGDPLAAGAPMPRTWDGPSAPPLAAEEQRILSDWIAGGAPFFDESAAGD